MVTYPCERPALANLDDAALNMVELLWAHNPVVGATHENSFALVPPYLATNDRSSKVQFHEAFVGTVVQHAGVTHTRFWSVLPVVRV